MDNFNTVSGEWEKYREMCFGDKSSKGTIETLKRTFYAGAIVFNELQIKAAAENSSDAAAMAVFSSLRQELNDFINEVETEGEQGHETDQNDS